MPRLSFILSNEILTSLSDELKNVNIQYHQFAISVQRKVSRVPVKPMALSKEEEEHMKQSLDGLSCFHPVDIYNTNIQAYDGLLRAIRKCQELEGFGSADSEKYDEYSCLLLDISTFWMAFRLLYSFTGLSSILHDSFIFLGPWHIYMYSHVLVWSEFRSSFLASAFFALFPKQNLFFRPKLVSSSTFFTWLRASYPSFRNKLLYALHLCRHLRDMYSVQFTRTLRKKKILPQNPYDMKVLQLHNLLYLFDFVLPTVSDYGCALKLNNWNLFNQAFIRIFRIFLSSKSQGTLHFCNCFSSRYCSIYTWNICLLRFVQVLGGKEVANL